MSVFGWYMNRKYCTNTVHMWFHATTGDILTVTVRQVPVLKLLFITIITKAQRRTLFSTTLVHFVS